MTNDRVKWLDTAKGIGILLVIFGHLQSNFAHEYLYSFLMPLFFFIAGQTNGNLDNVDAKLYLKKQVTHLMYPYYVWGVLLLLFWIVFDRNEGNICENVFGLITGFGGSRYMAWGVMFWFLPSLLASKVVYFLVHKYFNSIKLLILLIVVAIGFTLGYYSIWLPYSVHASLVLVLFYHLGYKYQRKIAFNKIGYLIVFGFLWFLIASLNGRITTYLGMYGNPLLFILGAMLGVICFISLSQLLQKVEFFNEIGKNSLVIFMIHLRAITLVKALQLYWFEIPIQNSLWHSIVYTAFAILISLPVSKIINKRFPWMVRYERIKNVH